MLFTLPQIILQCMKRPTNSLSTPVVARYCPGQNAGKVSFDNSIKDFKDIIILVSSDFDGYLMLCLTWTA